MRKRRRRSRKEIEKIRRRKRGVESDEKDKKGKDECGRGGRSEGKMVLFLSLLSPPSHLIWKFYFFYEARLTGEIKKSIMFLMHDG